MAAAAVIVVALCGKRHVDALFTIALPFALHIAWRIVCTPCAGAAVSNCARRDVGIGGSCGLAARLLSWRRVCAHFCVARRAGAAAENHNLLRRLPNVRARTL
jgi:hypothetical protein